MKRFFRTTLALTLAAALLLTGCFALAESSGTESISFEPTLTNAVDRTTSEWMESGWSRAAATVLLALDVTLSLDDDADSPNLAETSFIGESDDQLVVFLHGESCVFLIIYSPSSGDAIYGTVEVFSDEVIEATLEDQCDRYYQNDPSDIYDVVQTLQEILESND